LLHFKYQNKKTETKPKTKPETKPETVMYTHNPTLLWSEIKAKGRIKHGGFWMGARGVCVCVQVCDKEQTCGERVREIENEREMEKEREKS
jgi:hypothetical protein